MRLRTALALFLLFILALFAAGVWLTVMKRWP